MTSSVTSESDDRKPYRVILWAPGMAGQLVLRELLARPEFEVVGCLAYSPNKAGTDIGTLVGASPTGVTITCDKEAIYARPADIVVYAGRAVPDDSVRVEEITRLLQSGKNVVTITDFFFPWQRSPPDAAQLEVAGRAGNSTLHGTGMHPGWFMERFVMTLTSLCTRVDSIEVQEVVDMSHHTGQSIRNIGYGMPLERLGSTTRKNILSRYYVDSIAGTAHLMGVCLDRITADISYPLATKRIELPTLTIEPGTVAVVDGTWIGYADGEPFITMREFWYMDGEMVDFTALTSPDIYDVVVRGAPVDTHTRLDLSVTSREDIFGMDDLQVGAKLTTAVQLINTIPAVVDAAPGILLTGAFAYPSRDLRDVADPLRRAPRQVRVEMLGAEMARP